MEHDFGSSIGLLKYEYGAWEKEVDIDFNGKTYKSRLTFTVEDGRHELTDRQQIAYADFLLSSGKYLSKAVEEFIPFCKKGFSKCLSIQNVENSIEPRNVIFHEDGTWEIMFDCVGDLEDNELGLAIRFSPDEPPKVGTQANFL